MEGEAYRVGGSDSGRTSHQTFGGKLRGPRPSSGEKFFRRTARNGRRRSEERRRRRRHQGSKNRVETFGLHSFLFSGCT